MSEVATITASICQKISRNRQLSQNVNPHRYDPITFEAATSYVPSAWINAPWLTSILANDGRISEHKEKAVAGCRPDILIRILDVAMSEKTIAPRIDGVYRRLVLNTRHWLHDLMQVDETGTQQPPCLIWRQMYPQTQLGLVVHFKNDHVNLILRGWELNPTETIGLATLQYESGIIFTIWINLLLPGSDWEILDQGPVHATGSRDSIVFNAPGSTHNTRPSTTNFAAGRSNKKTPLNVTCDLSYYTYTYIQNSRGGRDSCGLNEYTL